MSEFNGLMLRLEEGNVSKERSFEHRDVDSRSQRLFECQITCQFVERVVAQGPCVEVCDVFRPLQVHHSRFRSMTVVEEDDRIRSGTKVRDDHGQRITAL
jgi:hypothetical protein